MTLEQFWNDLWPKLETKLMARSPMPLREERHDGLKTFFLQYHAEPPEDLTRIRVLLIKNEDEVYVSEFACRERILNRLEPYYEETEAFFRSIKITPRKK